MFSVLGKVLSVSFRFSFTHHSCGGGQNHIVCPLFVYVLLSVQQLIFITGLLIVHTPTEPAVLDADLMRVQPHYYRVRQVEHGHQSG